jgi:hypothetical protein
MYIENALADILRLAGENQNQIIRLSSFQADFRFHSRGKICHEVTPIPNCHRGSCTLLPGACTESAPASAVVTDFVWDYVIDRTSCTSADVLPAFDVRAESGASSQGSEVVGA